MEPPTIVNGLLHFRAPVPRIPFCEVLELKGAMQRDIDESVPRSTAIDQAVMSIVALVASQDDPACCFDHNDASMDADIDFSHYPPVIRERLEALRRTSNSGRRSEAPEHLRFIVEAAIAQWLAATGRPPTLMESDIEDDPLLRAQAPLYHSLRAMLKHTAPDYVEFLTPSVFLSAVRRVPKGIEFVLVPSRPLGKRKAGRPRTRETT